MSDFNGTPDAAFSPDELRRRCMDNVDLAKRVLQAFLAHGEREVASLEHHATVGQSDEAAKIAHRLKGASDNVAAHRLCGLAAALERSARGGDSDLATQISAIRVEWGRFQGLAKDFLSPAQASSSIPPSV